MPSGAALPSQLGVILSGGCDDAGQGINEMPLGANVSLIGVTYCGTPPRTPELAAQASCLVRISN